MLWVLVNIVESIKLSSKQKMNELQRIIKLCRYLFPTVLAAWLAGWRLANSLAISVNIVFNF